MSVVDKTLQDENIRLKEQLKKYMDLFETLEKACDSDDDDTDYNSSEESETDNSEMGECDEESTDDELNPKSKLENLEIKINN